MESQGNYAVVADRIVSIHVRARSKSYRSERSFLHSVVHWLLWGALLLCLGVTEAQTTNPVAATNAYVYDANGRLVAITKADGTSTQYTYDALGNLKLVGSQLQAGQLAMFAFTPSHGTSGTTVTIEGQGFSSTLANDSVSFNGSVATVMSATPTQLVTSVPSGASTGPITVTVGSQTASSATSFVVDDTGSAPMITTVSPSTVAAGSSLTVTGMHLDPVAGQTVLLFGGRDVSTVSSISDSQIQHVVSASDTSGFVTVETPYGQAVSTSPIIVLPSGLSAASITSTGYAANGSSVNLNISAGGQTGAMLFNGNVGDWISLQLSAIDTTANNINYAIYAPGNQLILQGTVSSSSSSIHLPQLQVDGTYLAVFTPDTAGAQLTVGFEGTGQLTVGTQATVVTTIQGQSKRLLFQAIAGQALTLMVGNTVTNPSGQAVSYTIYNPGQDIYTSGSTSSSGMINLAAANTGTYQLIVAPGDGATGSEQVELVPGIEDTLPANGQSGNYSGYVVGQNVSMTFTANQGDNLELTLSGVSVAGSGSSPVMVNVYDANGTNISSADNCFQQWTCRYPLWNLAAGTYTVVVSPPDANSTVGFTGMLEPDISGPALSANTPVTVNLSLGQVERLTFNANAGDNVAVSVSNASTSNPGGLPVYVNVYRPDVGTIATGNYYTTANITDSGTINMQSLPVSGTYTVVVYTSGVPGTAQLTIGSLLGQPIAANGTNQYYPLGGTGQNVFMTFSANQGDNLELTLNGVMISGSGSLNVNVYDSNGTNISSGSGCYAQWTCRYSLWNLAAGTYLVVVSPPSATSAVGFYATLSPDITGPVLSANTPTTVSLSLGQVERLTFNANAGDSVALDLSNVSTSQNGLSVYVSVYRPDVGTITTGDAFSSFSATSSNTLTLQNLPVSGTYTVVVSTSGVVGSAVLELAPQ